MQNLKPLASLYSWAGQFESYLVANPKDRFSRDEAQFVVIENVSLIQIQKLTHDLEEVLQH